MITSLNLPVMLVKGIQHYMKIHFSKSMKAATLLADTVTTLRKHPETLDAIRGIFGNYPLPGN